MDGWMLYTKYILLVGKESLRTTFDLGHYGRPGWGVMWHSRLRQGADRVIGIIYRMHLICIEVIAYGTSFYGTLIDYKWLVVSSPY